MKANIEYDLAHKLVTTVSIDLMPGCKRIEIAGSVRRKKPEVGDLEIVCIPKTIGGHDMFGPVAETSALPGVLNAVGEKRGWRLIKGGQHYKQIDMGPINLDLFITTEEQWGMIYTIRTGSADFSHWLVTPRRYGGAMPGHLRAKDGRLWNGAHPIETPEEQAVFDAIGLEWLEPEERTGPMVSALKRGQYV